LNGSAETQPAGRAAFTPGKKRLYSLFLAPEVCGHLEILSLDVVGRPLAVSSLPAVRAVPVRVKKVVYRPEQAPVPLVNDGATRFQVRTRDIGNALPRFKPV